MTTAKREKLIVIVFFLITLLMTNPPIVNVVNSYAQTKPLILGWPTLWIWLEFWYLLMIGGMIWFGLRFKTWRAEYTVDSAQSNTDGGE